MSATTDRPSPSPRVPPGAPPRPGQEPGGSGRPPPPDRRPTVTGVVLIVVGSLWGLHALGVSITWPVLLPALVVAVGTAVLLGGRSPLTAGLVPLGVILAVVAGTVVLLPGVTSMEAGERSVVVREITELASAYELGAGQMTLDLRELDLPRGTTELRVAVGLGELRIRVPREVTVEVDGHVTAGELRAFGTTVGGLGAGRQIADAGRAGAGTLAIEARVGLGTLEVSR